jgi:hypothetical protein
MTAAQARQMLRAIRRTSANPGYTEPLSDIEIEGWIALFSALGLVTEEG